MSGSDLNSSDRQKYEAAIIDRYEGEFSADFADDTLELDIGDEDLIQADPVLTVLEYKFGTHGNFPPGSVMRASPHAGEVVQIVQSSPIHAVQMRPDDIRRGQMHRRERAAWAFLVLLTAVWALLTGMAVTLERFWLKPVTAVFGCLALGVLVATMFAHARDGND